MSERDKTERGPGPLMRFGMMNADPDAQFDFRDIAGSRTRIDQKLREYRLRRWFRRIVFVAWLLTIAVVVLMIALDANPRRRAAGQISIPSSPAIAA